MARFTWGGIRGKGIKLRGDVALAIVAMLLATLVVILAYFVFERSAVQMYTTRVSPTIKKADLVVNEADKLWDSDLFTKTPDPLTNEIDPKDMREQADSWSATLRQDMSGIKALKKSFADEPVPPNATVDLEAQTTDYLNATDAYITDANAMVDYFDKLITAEMEMNSAIRAVSYVQGLVDPAALHQRDATLDQELAFIQKLSPPPSLQVFHEDTVRFLSDYTVVQKETTAAYETQAGLTTLEALGAEGESVIHSARDRLKSDIRTIKTGQLGRESLRARAHKKKTHDEVDRLRGKYRF
jgi:hypothetical protein